MYEDVDLDAGVKAGLLTADEATALRNLAAARRGVPAADEERFGNIDGLADVMTAIAVALAVGCSSALLVAMFMGTPLAALPLVPILGCAEYFTRKRRLTLTSFVLFALFVVAWTTTCFGLALLLPGSPGMTAAHPALVIAPLQGIVTASGTALGCALYFWRFRLPVAYAASAVAVINLGIHVLRILMPDAPAAAVSLILLGAGVLLFLAAMWWDMSDIRRQTLRADVAFWLHAAAGFQIAGACYRLIVGVADSPTGWERLYSFALGGFTPTSAAGVLLFAMAFCMLSLAVDRRSLLMSSLAFVAPALAFLAGSGAPGWMMSLILIGVALLLLSAGWTKLRAALLTRLPTIVRAQLPRTDLAATGARPVY